MDEFSLINGVPAFVLEAKEESLSDDGKETKFTCYAFSDNGNLMAAGDDEGVVRVWRTDHFRLIKRYTIHSKYRVGCVRFLAREDNRLIVGDVYGNFEHVSLAEEQSLRWSLPSVTQIQMSWFIDNDDLALAMAMDPESMSAKLYPPITSADGTVIAQAITSKRSSNSLTSDATIFVERVVNGSRQRAVLCSPDRSLVSKYFLSDDGMSLLVTYCTHASYSGMTRRDQGLVEFWPSIRFDSEASVCHQVPCQSGKWANGGTYIIGWDNGSSFWNAKVAVWKSASWEATRGCGFSAAPRAVYWMESDDTIFNVEMVSPSRGDSDDDVVLAICYTEDNEDYLAINVWDSKQNAVILQLDTRTLYRETLYGLRQYLNKPQVMGYYWGHNQLIMENSLDKMCMSPCRKWIAFYSSECNRGFLWSLKDGIPVAKLDLPDSLADKNSRIADAMKTITFSPAGDRVLLVGRNRIVALVPAFLQKHRGLQMNHIHTSEERYVTFNTLSLSHDGSTAALSGQDKATNVSPAWNKISPAFLDILEDSGGGVQSGDYSESSEGMKVTKDFSLSRDGSVVGVIFVDNTVAVADVKSARWDPVLKLKRFPSQSSYRVLSESKEDIFNRVFFATQPDGKEQVVCFSLLMKGCVAWFDQYYTSENFIDKIPISVDQTMGLKLTHGNTRAILLSTQTAQIIDLQGRTIIERVNFNLSIPRARQVVAAESSGGAQVFFSEKDEMQVSPDGKKVLLGWDPRHSDPFYLTSTGRSARLKRQMEVLTEGVITYVHLSEDGRWVTVAYEEDVDGKKRKGISINDTSGKREARIIPDDLDTNDLDTSGCEPLFALSGDGRGLVLRSVFERGERESTLYDTLQAITPYAIEGSIPDCERLRLTERTGSGSARKRAAALRSEDVFLVPALRRCGPG